MCNTLFWFSYFVFFEQFLSQFFLTISNFLLNVQYFTLYSVLTGRPMRLYRTPLTQPVYAIGKTQITHSQARLFNLFDKNGNINMENIRAKSQNESDINYNTTAYSKTFTRVKNLALPRDTDLSYIVNEEEKEHTFVPTRSKQAGQLL